MKTTAVRLYGSKDLRLESFELREIRDDEILIKIISDSVCMSTHKTALQGAKHIRVPNDVSENPIIVGHEFCAIIEKVGNKWKDQYNIGEKVICPPVLSYLGGYETIGYSFCEIGGCATYAIVYEHIISNGFLIKLNSDAYFKGSLIEPASCVLRGFKANYHLDSEYNPFTNIKPGGSVAILAGCGPMGLVAIDVALHGSIKPKRVVVTDVDDERLKRAESIFAPKANGTELIFSNATDKDSLVSFTDGKGYDDVFVYTPIPAVIELADSILTFDGCLNFFAGPIDKTLSAKMNFYDVHYAQHHIAGTSGSTPEDMKDVVDMIGNNYIDPSVMVTHVGGINAAIDTTLRLPEIPGGKKLIYTHINMPLTAISDFEKIGKTDKRYEKLAELVSKNNGLWSADAEKYVLDNF